MSDFISAIPGQSTQNFLVSAFSIFAAISPKHILQKISPNFLSFAALLGTVPNIWKGVFDPDFYAEFIATKFKILQTKAKKRCMTFRNREVTGNFTSYSSVTLSITWIGFISRIKKNVALGRFFVCNYFVWCLKMYLFCNFYVILPLRRDETTSFANRTKAEVKLIETSLKSLIKVKRITNYELKHFYLYIQI